MLAKGCLPKACWRLAVGAGIFLFWTMGLPVFAADSCSSSDSCGFGRICVNNECVEADNCIKNFKKQCVDTDLFWYDSCDNRGSQAQDCGNDTFTSEYQCQGNIVQQKVIGRGCDVDRCREVTGWVPLQNCADTGNVCKNGACRADTATPPLLYYLEPSGTVDSPDITLSLTTNEAAECHYSYYDVDFEQMTGRFYSPDGIGHSVDASLSAAGKYTFYVRCKDVAGSPNLVSSKISFDYVPNIAGQAGQAENGQSGKDIVPPVIDKSSILPSGTIDKANTEIALTTDEKASCRFDINDIAYDSMSNLLNTDGSGKVHRRSVRLTSPGRYVYYVRCKDAAGNSNKTAAAVEFTYTPAVDQSGLVISDARPFGTIYQKEIALQLSTSTAANCRYSASEADLEINADLFSTDNGLQHIAIVSLGQYGNYRYFVRCADNNEPAKTASAQIAFQFRDPDEATAVPAVCDKISSGSGNGICDGKTDCVCDPDCDGSKDKNDPDCASGMGSERGWGSIGYLQLFLVAGAFAAGIAGFIFVVRRRGGSDGFDGGDADGDESGL